MLHLPRLTLLGALLLLAGCSGDRDEQTSPADYDTVNFSGRISSLGIPAAQLEGNWRGPSGAIYDDFYDLDSLPAIQQSMAEPLKKLMVPFGIRASGDFIYINPDDPGSIVTLSVFQFDSATQCDAYWKLRYVDTPEAPLLNEVANSPYRAVDQKSEGLYKRHAAFGNILLTAHQLRPGDEHIHVLERYAKHIRESQ